MAPSPNPLVVFYADYSPRVRRFNFSTSVDVLLSTLPPADTVDGGLSYDGISGRVLAGAANSGTIYLVHPTIAGSPILFASGFSNVVGVLREPLTGDLYVLEWHRLFRLCSNYVSSTISTVPSASEPSRTPSQTLGSSAAIQQNFVPVK